MRTNLLLLCAGLALGGPGCGGGGGGGADAGVGSDAGPGVHAVGGTVTGLYGTVVLEDNGGDDLTLTTSGSFQFATTVADGEAYAVTVKNQSGTVCTVANGSAIVAGADITNVAVSCTDLMAFASLQALDGSGGPSANGTTNVWAIAPDGSHLGALTDGTAAGAYSYGPDWSPDGTRIVYSSRRALNGADTAGSTYNIWIMNADGSDPHPLTTLTPGNAQCYYPQWSPDGTKIIFESARALDGSNAVTANVVHNVWIMNPDGTGQTPLTNNTATDTAADYGRWSPDGKTIAYQSLQNLNGTDTAGAARNIWTVRADGSLPPVPVTHIADAGQDCELPQWSPDGQTIVFDAVDGSGKLNIFVTASDGSGTPAALTTLTTTYARAPGWSPDGQHILYASRRDLTGLDAEIGATNIWMIDPNGNNDHPLTQLTAASVVQGDASWSPDGTQIAYDSNGALGGGDALNTGGATNVWIMKPDGSNATPLTNATDSGAISAGPTWVR